MVEQKTQETQSQTSKEMEPFISERIRRSEAQLLHHSHEAILINRFDTNRIVFWNRRASELYGWSHRETKGKVSHDVLQTKFSEPVQEIKTTLLRNGHWQGELTDRRKDGSPVVVRSRWVLQRSFAGAPNNILQLNQDVTAVTQRVEAARESKRLALLGTMAGVFAHEVANPLTGLSAALQFVESALERREFDGPLRSVVHGALREIDRLGSLLTDFRSIAHPRIADLKTTDLVKIVEEVLACQLLSCRALGITVKLQFNDLLPPMMADAGQIKQVILNLCKNAVEAMPGGGRLNLKGYHSGQMVVFEISDSGAGIPEGVNIFELFKTTKPDGSGLGLPLVQQIVSAHHGTIEYTTEPGRGTTFKIYLPVANGAQDSHVREAHRETTRKQIE